MNRQVLQVDRGPITRIILNRPEKLNALNAALGDAFIDALTQEGFRPEVRVLIIAGAGRAFCAGDDISGSSAQTTAYDRSEPLTYANLVHYYRMQSALRQVPKPVIAQVHGYCLGAGMDIVLASDYAVVDPEAKLGLVFVKRAIAAGMVMLPRHIGLKQATRLLFEGDIIAPQDALDLGLISHVSAPDALAADVEELAQRLADGPTRTYGHIKAGLNRAYFPGVEDELRHMAFMQSFATRTADSAEAKLAWRERRAPQFSGV